MVGTEWRRYRQVTHTQTHIQTTASFSVQTYSTRQQKPSGTKNKRIISWSVFFSLPWLRFTERSHVICSASPHISYIFFWCHCANCLITMNVYDAVGWRAMSENWEKLMKKRSIWVKNVHNYFNDLKRLVSKSLTRSSA